MPVTIPIFYVFGPWPNVVNSTTVNDPFYSIIYKLYGTSCWSEMYSTILKKNLSEFVKNKNPSAFE